MSTIRQRAQTSHVGDSSEPVDNHEIQNGVEDIAAEKEPKPSLAVHIMTHQRLTRDDKGNIALLVLLYMLQGVPVGLAFGSVPFLLKQKVSFSDIGFFSIAQYPYSLKLLWSPIVDSVFWKALGRRKSWIVPMQTMIALLFVHIGQTIDAVLADDNVSVPAVTYWFLALVACAATQDIAVDGWALELLRKEHREYASTCQTIGLNTGYFLSFTIFLALNSPDFCNSYIRAAPAPDGLVQLGAYMQFWGIVAMVTTAWLALFKHEPHHGNGDMTVGEAYRTIWSVAQMGSVRTLLVILMVHKIGYMANDAVTALLLIDKGFRREHLALTVLLDFPCQIALGILAARWSSGARPTRPWMYGQLARLAMCAAAMGVVWVFPAEGPTPAYIALVVVVSLLASFASTVMFVSQGAFFARVSDVAIGGTYLTLLNTFSNFGGTWPKIFVLQLVDMYTEAACQTQGAAGAAGECVTEHGKALCRELGGQCVTSAEGYYPVSAACIALGLAVFVAYVRPQCRRLEQLPHDAWLVQAKP